MAQVKCVGCVNVDVMGRVPHWMDWEVANRMPAGAVQLDIVSRAPGS